MRIVVEPMRGSAFILDVEASDTINVVKTKILFKKGIPPDEQILFHKGKLLLTENVVSHYNMQNGAMVELELRFPIKVTTLSGKIITLFAEQSLSVFNVKTRLELEDGIPREQQQLVLGETVMEDWCRLYDYDIQKDTILQLVKNQKRKRMFFVDDRDEDGETDDEFENDEEEDE